MQYDGGGSHGLLNVVTQDTALKGRAKRPFSICVTAEAAEVPVAHLVRQRTDSAGTSVTEDSGQER